LGDPRGEGNARRAERDFLSDGHEAPPLVTGAHPLFDDVKPGDVRGWLIGVGGYTPQPIPRTDDEGKVVGYWRAEDVMQDRCQATTAGEPRTSVRVARAPSAYAREGSRLRVRTPRRAGVAERGNARSAIRPAETVPIDLYWLPVAVALMLLALRFRPDLRIH
jgi:mxaL protein